MRILGGRYKGMSLFVPAYSEVRPALARMRNSLFNILMGRFENAKVLDLFAGTGSLGLEALSRGADLCLFVEDNRACFDVIRQNIVKLKAEPYAQLVAWDAFKILDYLERNPQTFNLIFIDPPYKYYTEPAQKATLLNIIDAFAEKNILAPQGLIIVEHRSSQIKDELSDLPHLKRIDIREYGQTTLSFLAKR